MMPPQPTQFVPPPEKKRMSVAQIMLIIAALGFLAWYLITSLAPEPDKYAYVTAGTIGTRYSGMTEHTVMKAKENGYDFMKAGITEVQTDDVDAILQQIIEGHYTIEQRSLLNLSIIDKDGIIREGLIMSPNALNEIAILKQGLTNMLTIETKVNGELLHTYHSDGLVIATPTGSTAYNLSIGGPLIVPQTRGIILTPIAPHSLTVKPLVVPDDWKFDIRVTSRYDSFMVSVDGRSQSLSTDMTLHIERAPYTVKVVQIGDNSFLKSLRTKLNWGK